MLTASFLSSGPCLGVTYSKNPSSRVPQLPVEYAKCWKALSLYTGPSTVRYLGIKARKFGEYGTALLATSVNTLRLLVIGSLYWAAGEFILVLPCAAISSLVMPMTLTPCGLMLPGTLLHTEGKPAEEGVGGPKIYETCSSSVAESNPHISLPAFLLAGFLQRSLALRPPATHYHHRRLGLFGARRHNACR